MDVMQEKFESAFALVGIIEGVMVITFCDKLPKVYQNYENPYENVTLTQNKMLNRISFKGDRIDYNYFVDSEPFKEEYRKKWKIDEHHIYTPWWSFRKPQLHSGWYERIERVHDEFVRTDPYLIRKKTTRKVLD